MKEVQLALIALVLLGALIWSEAMHSSAMKSNSIKAFTQGVLSGGNGVMNMVRDGTITSELCQSNGAFSSNLAINELFRRAYLEHPEFKPK